MAITNVFEILIYPGLHSRPGKEFVNICMEHESSVIIKMNDNEFDGKSFLSLLKNKPSQSEIIHLIIDGKDENELMEKIINLETMSHKSKEDFDSENEELLQVFRLVGNE